VKNTSEETYEGIPRNKIPWHPTIDYEKCISCGKCIQYCTLGVYEVEQNQGKKRPVVKNPTSCVVLCAGCEEICPCDAIAFPSKEETKKIIGKFRIDRRSTRAKRSGFAYPKWATTRQGSKRKSTP
jgi:NAD-dependent dihydropyrimidine dehydrogenase PreA subunit